MIKKRKVAFLAGVFPRKQHSYITRNSIGVIQNAADAYQKNVIAGLAKNDDVEAVVVNLPFVSAWPSSFKKPWFPRVHDSENGVSIDGRGFSNVSLIRYPARIFASMLGLSAKQARDADTILVYSAHVPFMLAAVLVGRLFSRRQLAIIVLDLPEYMGAMGLTHKIFGGFNKVFFYHLIRYFDKFVVLTEAMVSRLDIDPEKAVVVEGIASLSHRGAEAAANDGRGETFLYTGTLARRYGIEELVKGFQQVESPEAALWICGAGEGASFVAAAAKADPRIVFFGQVDRSRALELQRAADFLINPRNGNDEFVRYSFPSKIMEYLTSGRPVIMYNLPGIPEDYHGHYLPIHSSGAAGICAAITSAISMPANARNALGAMASDFVRAHKGPREQVRRILDLLYPL
ncbi:glycosyltransferase [Altererythrobacter aquiaggeris]|uniref:glycosyltransferase n=1 Tax=Aestuarierythrobacter aquiaggeris TaxID=1898396 RepID=UPI003016698D